MKKLLIASVSILALSAGATFADSISEIEQQGPNNVASVDQIGGNNYSSVYQGGSQQHRQRLPGCKRRRPL